MNDFIILDGAMGTMLQKAGLSAGQLPELLNLTAPEQIASIHSAYAASGSRVIYANTFGANRKKLAGSGISPAQVIAAGIQIAREAVPQGVKIALDIGPIGQMMEPLGTLTFREAYDIFREMVVSGEAAGADLIVFETMGDLAEARAGVLAAKENTSLPVWVTMTFQETGRTFLGCTPASMGLTLSGLGVDAMGFNCSLGPRELLPMVRELSHYTDVPLILKPNAGLPDPATGEYAVTAEEFADALADAVPLGVRILGGCCGTTPEFICALREKLSVMTPVARKPADRKGVCSSRRAALFDSVRVIGERINPTGKKRLAQALREGDMAAVMKLGVEQEDAGADILDVNVGLPGIDEAEMMEKAVRALQSVTDLPLQIDSSDPKAIEAGLRVTNGKAIVNSVNGNQETLDSVLPLCAKYGAAVVGLTMDERGIPRTAAARVDIARHILDAALAYGIPKDDVFIDCLTLTVSAEQEQARETLEAVRRVRVELGVHAVLGVSNVSFGLPEREHVTVSFLTQALAAGLDLPIVNPNNAAVMDAIAAYRVLSGEDDGAQAYVRRFAAAAGKPDKPRVQEMTLDEAVERGLGDEVASLIRQALETMTEMEAVDTLLIPALDRVGQRYERQELFLPQLIGAANAACQGFDVVKERIAARGTQSISKGKIVLATVQGDIHDIGKNIVRVVLENYGYTVIDLGKDVPIEAVADAVEREGVRLVGLSALMTTTVGNMEKTISAIRARGCDCKIMVGGAVLTEPYALSIGADFYAKDAKASADIARKVLG